MARLRSLAIIAPLIAASALTVALSPAGGSALAASQAPGRADGPAGTHQAGVAFQPLTLTSWWSAGMGGIPRAGLSNGVVYLAGSLTQTGSGTNEAGTLPAGKYLPGRDLYLPAYTASGTGGEAVIHSDGRVAVLGPGYSVYTSLAGISYPVALKSGKLTLVNGWQAVQGSTGNAGAALGNGVVYLSGALSQPSGTGSTFATLPKADRPARVLYVPIFSTDGKTGLTCGLKVTPSGQVSVFGDPAVRNFSSLAGVSFPIALKSSKLTLASGWKTAPGTAAPRVSLSHGVVYLSGAVSGGSQVLVTTLPAADRPAHTVFMPVSMAGGTAGRLAIDPQGHVYVNGNNATALTSLEGVHFPLGS